MSEEYKKAIDEVADGISEIKAEIVHWSNNCGGCETCAREFPGQAPEYDMQTVFEIICAYENSRTFTAKEIFDSPEMKAVVDALVTSKKQIELTVPNLFKRTQSWNKADKALTQLEALKKRMGVL